MTTSWWGSLRIAVGFLTVVPGGGRPDPAAVVWFPVVGAGVGVMSSLLWWWSSDPFGPPVAAALFLVADVALTGFLHVDGLVDAADGLLPPFERRERRLEVMARPDAGAFGVATLVLVLLTCWSALLQLEAERAVVLGVAAAWATTRGAMGVTMAVVPPARSGGLGRRFHGAGVLRPTVSAVLVVVACAAASGGDVVLVVRAVVAAAGAFSAVVAMAHVRLGGHTGDVLGAAGMIGQAAALVALVAR